jgi:hypothetical protein
MMNGIRDSLLETAPAKATTAGGIFVATGANALAERVRGFQNGDGNYVGTGGSDDTYLSLDSGSWGSGTSVGFAVTTGTSALVIYGANLLFQGADQETTISYRITGATSVSVSDVWAVRMYVDNGTLMRSVSRVHLHTGLTAGSNTFQMQGKSTDISNARIIRPYLFVLPI